MKRTVLIITIHLLPLISSGQKIELGGEFGFHMSQLEYNGNTSERVGNLAAFFTMDFLFFKNFSLASKLGYISKGGKNLNERNPNFKADFDYVSLYVSPRFYFLSKSKVHPYAHVSPSISYLLGADANGTDIKDDTENLDFGIQGGVGLKIDLKESLIMDFNAGFEQGFSRVISVQPDQFHNRLFPYIGIGIRHLLE
ncbi:outer membrane beta-barrel protein [Ulvibacterium sp.]|uniref:outer membrane beta-barrel protein n=1 Tax=Ulvibacterium sp. TaxID=2665914 RepID=UPI003BAADB6B